MRRVGVVVALGGEFDSQREGVYLLTAMGELIVFCELTEEECKIIVQWEYCSKKTTL